MKEYVSLEGEFVTVCFGYSPNKLQAIRKIRGSRFDKEKKIWRVPASSLPALKRTWCFNPSKIEYITDDLTGSKRCPDAVSRINDNPYSVPFKDISAAKPDVVLELDEVGLIVTPFSGCEGEDIVRGFSGLVYSQTLESFYFPLSRLKTLLALLKKRNIFFAVEEESAAKLEETAPQRNAILKKGFSGSYSKEELHTSLLGPYLYSQDGKLSLERVSEYHLKKLKISETSIDNYLAEAYQQNLPLWLTAELLPDLSGERVLEDHLSPYSKATQMFYLKGQEPYSRLTGKVPLEDLQDLLAAHPKAQTTKGFDTFCSQTQARIKALKEKKNLLEANDADLSQVEFTSSKFPADLFPHQRVAVRWLLNTRAAFLGDDMGLGKTVSVLSYFDALSNKNSNAFLLVICPRSLCINWYREARKWIPKALITTLPSDKRGRSKLLTPMAANGASGWNGLVLNYESARLEDVQPVLSKICQKRPVLLCLDESQRVKNPMSKTFAALAKFSGLAKRRVLLSGTPTPREFSDIWAQMKLLDGGERLGVDYIKWLGKIAELGNDWSAYAVREYKQQEVKKEIVKVQEVLLRRKKENVVDLPEKLFSVRDIELTGSQAKKYKEITKELRVRISSLGGSSYVKEIDNILEEYLRAVQVASNPRLIDESWKGEPAKFLELDEIVNELVDGDQKVVVWTNFRRNIKELCERYKKYGARPFSGEVTPVDRDRYIKEFQSKESGSKVLVAVPAAGGVGITLTAANTCVYIDKTWNAEHWLQSIDRVHRIGQTGTVSVISLHGCKVDQFISYNLSRKEKMLKEVVGDSTSVNSKPSKEELLSALAS